MLKLLTIIGARPQIIKAAALSRTIRNKFSDKICEILVHTGQHYDSNMSEVFFEELEIPKPDYNLNIGSGKQGAQTAKMISGIEDILDKETPDYVVLYGDTNSTLAGAVAASKTRVPIVHIEAGLRSFNKKMPEEINRIICDHCSTYLFTPTQTGYNNLINEGFSINTKPFSIDNPGLLNYGDIMYDNSIYFSELAEKKSVILKNLNPDNKKFVLATVHRDYNTDNENNLLEILKAFHHISIDNELNVIFPIHPRTLKIINALSGNKIIDAFLNNNWIQKIEPVSFLDMIQLEKNACVVLTDSGGVQKEAYFFNKPCVIIRTETEWVEILETGQAILSGANTEKIIEAFNKLFPQAGAIFPQIFGQGNTAELICKELLSSC